LISQQNILQVVKANMETWEQPSSISLCIANIGSKSKDVKPETPVDAPWFPSSLVPCMQLWITHTTLGNTRRISMAK
jgi:hypothetical protein